MGRLLRTKRWISFTITGLVAIVGFGLLSNWQWHRAAQEHAASDVVAANAQQQASPIESLLAPGEPLPADLQWRAATATGVYDCAAGALIRNRPLAGANGLWAACPLVTRQGDVVWVNRGWLAAGRAATESVPMPASPAGEVTVTGRLRPSEQGPAEQPTDLPAGQATHLDTGAMPSPVPGAEVFTPYLELTASRPDQTGLVVLPLPEPAGSRNVSYAMQWLIFAAITVAGWFYFLRREAREDLQRDAAERDRYSWSAN